jgi:hypothetical protein
VSVGRIAAALAACLAFVLASAVRADTSFSFGVFGDVPYSDLEEAAVERLIYEMNREPLAFVVHVGDIKSGSSACTDAVFESRRELLARSRHHLVFVPGDNEWTDCWRASAGGWDPRERLARLREIFFRDRLTLGGAADAAPLAPLSQRDAGSRRCTACVENMRWSRDGVSFLTMHVTGSNNNFGRTPEQTAEWRERNRAVLAWLEESMSTAARESARAIVIFIHGNPWFERTEPGRAPARVDGFTEFRAAIAAAARRFARPMLLIHGDTHVYRDDQPLFDSLGARVENFRRLEVHGSPIVNWLRVTVTPASPTPFSVRSGFPQPLGQ